MARSSASRSLDVGPVSNPIHTESAARDKAAACQQGFQDLDSQLIERERQRPPKRHRPFGLETHRPSGRTCSPSWQTFHRILTRSLPSAIHFYVRPLFRKLSEGSETEVGTSGSQRFVQPELAQKQDGVLRGQVNDFGAKRPLLT